MSKRFNFENNFIARNLLVRIQRHISQTHCKYDVRTGLFNPPPSDSPFWIVERLLVQQEKEFDEAKARRRRIPA